MPLDTMTREVRYVFHYIARDGRRREAEAYGEVDRVSVEQSLRGLHIVKVTRIESDY